MPTGFWMIKKKLHNYMPRHTWSFGLSNENVETTMARRCSKLNNNKKFKFKQHFFNSRLGTARGQRASTERRNCFKPSSCVYEKGNTNWNLTVRIRCVKFEIQNNLCFFLNTNWNLTVRWVRFEIQNNLSFGKQN